MPQYKPVSQGEISPSNFSPRKTVFAAAVSTKSDSRTLLSLLAAVFACSTEGWMGQCRSSGWTAAGVYWTIL